MSSLLDEAIIDAKALKAAALKNAENAVLEKYSIEVKDALSTLLEQEDLGLDLGVLGDPADEVPAADDSFLAEVPYAFQNEAIGAAPEDELIEIDFNELKTRIAEEEAAGIEPSPEELLSSEEVAMELAEATGGTGGPESPAAYEDEDTEGKASMAGPDDPGLMGGAAEDESDEDMDEAVEDDEDIALTEEMLSDLIEDLVAEKMVVDMTPRPQGWASLSSADNSIEQANNAAMAAAGAASLEEEDSDEEEEDITNVVSDATFFESKIAKLTLSNKEIYALLLESTTQLKRLNLENAKLVYQNKALSSASLNERQKKQIVEAVQSANSVEEASMLFETIQNAVGVPNFTNRSRPQTLREAVQRPTSLLIGSKKNNTAIKDPHMGRMLRLAGLNK
jgi:hypothetical protein